MSGFTWFVLLADGQTPDSPATVGRGSKMAGTEFSRFEQLDSKGNWVESSELDREFYGEGSHFTVVEVSEEEALAIVPRLATN